MKIRDAVDESMMAERVHQLHVACARACGAGLARADHAYARTCHRERMRISVVEYPELDVTT